MTNFFNFFKKFSPPEKLIERELYWIIQKDSLNRDKGYNLAIPDINTKFKHNEETKEKCRRNSFKQYKGNKTEEEYLQWKEQLKLRKENINHRGDVSIVVIDKNTGGMLGEYSSGGECSKYYGYTNAKKVHEVLSKKRVAYKGLIFIYKKDYDQNKDYAIVKKRPKFKLKPFYQYDLNWNLIKIWNSIDILCQELNLNKVSVLSASSKLLKYKDFYWSRKNVEVELLEKEKSSKKEKESRGV